MAQSGKIVAVTGASGFVAGEVIKQLLEKGYVVRGTVRSLKDESKNKHLTETFSGIQLFEADLLTPGSFDTAFKGVDAVFHVASPFQTIGIQDPQKELIDPAVLGTKNVLSSVEKNLDTIKKVIVTSSTAAIIQQDPSGLPKGKVYDENDWNTTASLTNGPYAYSKYLAEKAAWEWAEGKPVKLITVNPSFVLGPPHSSRTDSTSVRVVVGFLDGTTKETGTPNICLGVVDLRDVGKAHVAAYENPNASGRYLVSQDRGHTHLELANLLQPEFGDKYPLPDKQNGEVTFVSHFSTAKLTRELGIELTPIQKSITDEAHALIKFGVVQIKN